MADLQIYNNGEGQILMSAGDRIIKQPYDTGRAYSNALSTNHYINITGLELENEYSYVVLHNLQSKLNNSVVNLFALVQTSSNRAENNGTNAGVGFNSVLYANTMETGSRLTINNGKRLLGISYRHYNNGITNVLNEQTFALSELDRSEGEITGLRDRFTIGSGGDRDSNFFTATKSPPEFFVNRVLIFNRELSIDELRYLFNNALFSELQFRTGLLHDWNLNKGFELLTLDSIDNLVGVKDQIGGRHGLVQALPAGTPEEKLEYANENLTVNFIS